jgi:hypothetical protein
VPQCDLLPGPALDRRPGVVARVRRTLQAQNPCCDRKKLAHLSHKKKYNFRERPSLGQDENLTLLQEPLKSIFKSAQYRAQSTTSICNATGSLHRFENKNILFYFEKRPSLKQHWCCSSKFKSRRIGSRGRFLNKF